MSISVVWFRKCLRIHDNPALVQALAAKTKHVFCLFVLDPHFIGHSHIGINRWHFMLEGLSELDERVSVWHFMLEGLSELDERLKCIGLRLWLLKGKPRDVFSKLFSGWKQNLKLFTFEKDTEPYAEKRDAEILQLAEQNAITVSAHA
eukprot:g32049.t1